MSKEPIIFKLNKDAFSIIIDEGLSFTTSKELLDKKFKDSEEFFDGVNLKTIVKGKEFSEEEFLEIRNIIMENTGFIDIKQEVKIFDWKDNAVEGNTKFYKGTMRSGNLIDFAGNVVVMGDVNPGAEIIATGNIVVTGAIKGMVHAGCKGNNRAIVCGMGIFPTQLRIGNIITVPPNEKTEKNVGFEIAYIKDSNIYIEKI